MLQGGEFVNKVKVLYSIGLHRVRDHSIFVLKVFENVLNGKKFNLTSIKGDCYEKSNFDYL